MHKMIAIQRVFSPKIVNLKRAWPCLSKELTIKSCNSVHLFVLFSMLKIQ